jgi:hypothetical protein
MLDVIMDGMAETGADVNSFSGRGRILHKNGVTVLWRERSGNRERCGRVVIAGSTGCC